MLNPHSPIPLYVQLAAQLRVSIQQGDLALGQRIASENSMAAVNGIGRPTVRQATEQLVQEGLLQRRKGSGTYVAECPVAIDLFSMSGTQEALRAASTNVVVTMVEPATLLPPNEERPALFADRACYRLARLSQIGSQPAIYEVMHLDALVFSNLEAHNFHSLSKLVREVYFLEPISVEQQFTIHMANAQLASLLKTEVETPVLKLARSLHFEQQQHAICSDIYCCTDRFEFTQTLYGSKL